MDHDEDKQGGQELQIVQAFSSVKVPERIVRSADIKALVGGMLAAQDEVGRSAEELERVRQEKKGGTIIGNWWKDRDNRVQDAQIDLQQSIGSLSQKSSQLLIVNAAISKVLSDQQRVLLQQQNLLKQQADILEEQNRKILGQQLALEHQQQEIEATNQGLLEARDSSVEHTDRLLGSVRRMEQAESQMEALNQQMVSSVAADLVTTVSDWSGRLDDLARDFKQRQTALERKLLDEFSEVIDHVNTQLAIGADKAASHAADLEGRQQQLAAASRERASAHEEAARQLRENLSERLTMTRQEIMASLEQSTLALRKAVQVAELRQESFLRDWAADRTQLHEAQEALERLEGDLKARDERLENAEDRLSVLEHWQERAVGALTAVSALALLSLGWQLAGALGVV